MSPSNFSTIACTDCTGITHTALSGSCHVQRPWAIVCNSSSRLPSTLTDRRAKLVRPIDRPMHLASRFNRDPMLPSRRETIYSLRAVFALCIYFRTLNAAANDAIRLLIPGTRSFVAFGQTRTISTHLKETRRTCITLESSRAPQIARRDHENIARSRRTVPGYTNRLGTASRIMPAFESRTKAAPTSQLIGHY